ncbi:hypothetical protein PS691_05759 [Pseudomonas fluorescens]|uniref:Uncharacterized protein n=1 Tax=Pseudomonas fluorescens TaxID=294 RepID=A0A5E7FNM3_PSEFL|nr:hypothetical protein PS691_05759 [Pseudomonas fluorescens]
MCGCLQSPRVHLRSCGCPQSPCRSCRRLRSFDLDVVGASLPGKAPRALAAEKIAACGSSYADRIHLGCVGACNPLAYTCDLAGARNPPVGAAAGCDLLILMLWEQACQRRLPRVNRRKDRSLRQLLHSQPSSEPPARAQSWIGSRMCTSLPSAASSSLCWKRVNTRDTVSTARPR